MAMTTSANQLKRPLFGDVEDEDEDDQVDDSAYFPPPQVVIESDANGTRKIISYEIDDEQGRRVKVRNVIRIPAFAAANLSRRGSWQKFGDAATESNRTRLNPVSYEDDISFQRPTATATKAEEDVTKAEEDVTKAEEDVKAGLEPLSKRGLVLMVCRKCGMKEDHWTSRCLSKENFSDKLDTYAAAPSGPSKGAYMITSPRQGLQNSSKGALDYKILKSDTEKAIAEPNGSSYDNSILGVEWAGPRAP